MKIVTEYGIGDKIKVGGEEHTILSAHIYVSETKQTERYYLGNGAWVTLGKEEKNQ